MSWRLSITTERISTKPVCARGVPLYVWRHKQGKIVRTEPVAERASSDTALGKHGSVEWEAAIRRTEPERRLGRSFMRTDGGSLEIQWLTLHQFTRQSGATTAADHLTSSSGVIGACNSAQPTA